MRVPQEGLFCLRMASRAPCAWAASTALRAPASKRAVTSAPSASITRAPSCHAAGRGTPRPPATSGQIRDDLFGPDRLEHARVAPVRAVVATGESEQAGGDEDGHQSLSSGEEKVRAGSPGFACTTTRRPSTRARPCARSAIARG